YRPKGKELIPLNNNYLTYKDTNRVMIVHQVDPDMSQEKSDITNVSEARAILALFRELREDKRYQDKSVGILTFFNAQAACIREIFESEGLKEERDNYKVSIIEGIQGDEKDIIIFSFVIRDPSQKNRYMPLTGEGGDIQADINRGRVNVAFSRARQMVHCFVSLPIEQVPDKIWIKRYLQYVQEYGEVDVNAVQLKPFDSHFEEEFYHIAHQALKRKYKIQNQVESCGFKIDFVIINITSGKKLAIECDGPCHFEDELDEEYDIYIENDEERQRILEAAGWRFYRIRYSDWINEKFDRKGIIKDIIQAVA
ncbi:MAG: AAA domain-containing protein, partial [bacterium]|nr:AAA domain-containing protein [bacterium]